MPKSKFLQKIVKAEKVDKPAKVFITGPSGAGKTLGALLLAKGLTNDGKVLVIDTENRRNRLHVGDSALGDWKWDAFEGMGLDDSFIPPSPQNLVDIISEVEQAKAYDCIILDSLTHEWDWVKKYQSELPGGQKAEGRNWAKAKAENFKFVRKFLQTSIPMIVTARSKMETAAFAGSDSKKATSKLGLTPECEGKFPYECDFWFDIAENHLATMSKTAQALFEDLEFFKITEQHGKILSDFCRGQSMTPEEIAKDSRKRQYVSRIFELLDSLPESSEYSNLSRNELLEKTEEELISLGTEINSQIN